MKYKNLREEELKNKVGVDWFNKFDHTEILGNYDFHPVGQTQQQGAHQSAFV